MPDSSSALGRNFRFNFQVMQLCLQLRAELWLTPLKKMSGSLKVSNWAA